MEKQHSPLPWNLRIETDLRGEEFNLPYIEDANQVEVLPTFPSIFEKDKADAALIVRCVNSHSQIVEALEIARIFVSDVAARERRDHAVVRAERALPTIDTALAAAKGGQA